MTNSMKDKLRTEIYLLLLTLALSPRRGHHHLLHRGRDVVEDRQGLGFDRQHVGLHEGVSAIAFASKVTLEKV